MSSCSWSAAPLPIRIGVDPRLQSDGVGLGCRGVAAAMRQPPSEQAGANHLNVPAGLLLEAVVVPTSGMQVAAAGSAALVVGLDVVEIRLLSGTATAGRCACRIEYAHEVCEFAGGPVAGCFERVVAGRAGLEPVDR
jgi:hypothetical protein